MQSLLDLFLYKNVLYMHHWLGMLAFVATGVIVSLSSLVY